MTTNKGGRPKIYEDRIVRNISLPKEASIKADELRGQKPLTQFLSEIVCEHLGVELINT